jgi:hypothetical protein
MVFSRDDCIHPEGLLECTPEQPVLKKTPAKREFSDKADDQSVDYIISNCIYKNSFIYYK